MLLDELRARPTLLVIEDLQWADEATLDLVVLLARRMGTTCSLAVVTCRDDELSADHPLRLVLGGLAAAGVERLRLSPLSIDAVRELSASHQVDTEALFRRTGGNPFYVTEVLAAAGRSSSVGARRRGGPRRPARPAGPRAARGCVDRPRHGAAHTGDRAGPRARRPARYLPRVRDARRVDGRDLLPARPRPCRHRRRDRAVAPRRSCTGSRSRRCGPRAPTRPGWRTMPRRRVTSMRSWQFAPIAGRRGRRRGCASRGGGAVPAGAVLWSRAADRSAR